MASMRVEWKGDDVLKTVMQAVQAGMTDYAGRWETAAKGSLRPGRGVVTSTYRRSLHAATPRYNFGNDDVPPRPGSPERGGRGVVTQRQGDTISGVVGSGMRYARSLENRYNVVRGAHDRVAPQLPGLIEKHAKAAGLK